MPGQVIAVVGGGEPHEVTLVRLRRYISVICSCGEQSVSPSENYAAHYARAHRLLNGYKDPARA